MSFLSVTSPLSVTMPNTFLDSPLSPVIMSPGPIITTTASVPVISPVSDDPIIDSPVLSSLNLTYSKPTFGFYENMNADPQLHERMVKHFYFYKTLGEWLYDEMVEILGYLEKGKDKKIHLIKNVNKYDESSVESDSKETIEAKIDFIKKHVLHQSDMMYILSRVVKDTNTNWYDLPHREHLVIRAVKRFLEKKLRKLVKNK